MATAKIKSTSGNFAIKIDLPNGRVFKLDWNEKNDHTVDVPVGVNFKDDFGREHTVIGNLAQHLLNNYDFMELVEEVKPDPIVAPKVEKRRKKDEKAAIQ
jgi:hypothetical protein